MSRKKKKDKRENVERSHPGALIGEVGQWYTKTTVGFGRGFFFFFFFK